MIMADKYLYSMAANKKNAFQHKNEEISKCLQAEIYSNNGISPILTCVWLRKTKNISRVNIHLNESSMLWMTLYTVQY